MKTLILLSLIFSFSLYAQNVPVGGQLDITNKSPVPKPKVLDRAFKKSIHENWENCGLTGKKADSLLEFYLQFKDMKMSVDPNIINLAQNKKCHETVEDSTDQSVHALCIILDENVQKVLSALVRKPQLSKDYFEKEINHLKKKKDAPTELPEAEEVYKYYKTLQMTY